VASSCKRIRLPEHTGQVNLEVSSTIFIVGPRVAHAPNQRRCRMAPREYLGALSPACTPPLWLPAEVSMAVPQLSRALRSCSGRSFPVRLALEQRPSLLS
jgi:hypothetical protein